MTVTASQNQSSQSLQPDPQVEAALADLRRRIDELDRRIVELLNERAAIVVEIGQRKRDREAPIYAPHREAQVLSQAITASKGPLPP
ncbi:MAG: chorismate mutase, partial [Planctomycetota bacterium]